MEILLIHLMGTSLSMPMSEEELEFHKKEARHCFNHAWDYLDKGDRSPQDDVEMLHLAHASRYHWGLVGGVREAAIGEWQISRIYAAIGQPSLSLRFAAQALGICELNDLTDLLHVAFEGMARASIAMGDQETARTFLLKARANLETLHLDADDRKAYLQQIEDTEGLLRAK